MCGAGLAVIETLLSLRAEKVRFARRQITITRFVWMVRRHLGWRCHAAVHGRHLLQDVRRRQNLSDILGGVGQLRQVDQIAVQRLVVGHALVQLADVLVLLDRLDEPAVLVEYFLNLRRASRRHTGRAAVGRHDAVALLLLIHRRRMLWRRLLSSLLLRSVRDRHFPLCRYQSKNTTLC